MRNVGRRRTPGLIWVVPWLSLAAALAGCAPRDRSAAAQPTRQQELAGAYSAFEQRQYDQAIAAADRVLSEDSVGPGSAEALYLKGRVEEQKAKEAGNTSQARDHLREARAVYQRALAIKPAQPLEAYLRAGLANASY